jgi:hypothetical protein
LEIKFWLAGVSKPGYLLNGFRYLEKDVHRPEGISLFEHVLKVMDPYILTG